MKFYLRPNDQKLHTEKGPQGSFLFETKQEVDFGVPIKYEGQTYLQRCRDTKEAWTEVEQVDLDMDLNNEKLYEENVVCPVCGCEHEMYDEDAFYSDSFECGNCGAILEFSRDVVITYDTSVKKLPTVIDIEEKELL